MKNIANDAVLDDLVARLQRLTPAHAATWGTMNGQQMARHLGDAAEAVLKRRPFASRARGKPSPLRKFLLLHVLRQMPRGIKAGADPAGAAVDPANFASDLSRAVTLLRDLAAAPPEALVEAHPVLGPMHRGNWMRWAYLHTDHHLRQFGV
jgi:hypothetical protein